MYKLNKISINTNQIKQINYNRTLHKLISHDKKPNLQTVFKIVTVTTTILLILFFLYAIKIGILKDKEILVQMLKKYHAFGPVIFIFIQVVQVVVPVIPGGASCLAGVVAFGPVGGFILNYIGLSLGSVLSFLIARKYGITLVRKIFTDKTVDKYLTFISRKNFAKILFIIILAPGLPDDLFCYIAGMTKMKVKTFILIILIGKPLSLLMYSIFFYLL